MDHTTLKPRIESAQEYGDGRRDWRTAHEAAGHRDGALRWIPATCQKCWKIEQEIKDTPHTPEEVATRLREEKLDGL